MLRRVFYPLLLLLTLSSSSAFLPATRSPASAARASRSVVSMGLFDNAFKNDPKLAAKKPAGKAAPTVTVTFNGGKKVQAPIGASLEQVARSARVNIPFNCKNGKCGTCEVLCDGSRVIKTCQTKVGKKDMDIVTK